MSAPPIFSGLKERRCIAHSSDTSAVRTLRSSLKDSDRGSSHHSDVASCCAGGKENLGSRRVHMGHKVVRKCSCLEMTTSLPLSNSLARAGHIPHHSRRGGRTDKRPRSTEGEKSSSSLMNTRGSTVSSGALWSGYATLAPTYGSFIPALITRAAPPSLTSSEFPDTTSVQEVAVLQVSDIVMAIPLSNRLDEQEGSPPCCFYWGPYPGRNTQNQAWRNPAQSTARPLEKN